jgi:hypothetical protein
MEGCWVSGVESVAAAHTRYWDSGENGVSSIGKLKQNSPSWNVQDRGEKVCVTFLRHCKKFLTFYE